MINLCWKPLQRANSKLENHTVAEQSVLKWYKKIQEMESQVAEALQKEREERALIKAEMGATKVLLSRLTFFDENDSSNSALKMFRQTAEAVMCGLIPNSPTATDNRTEGGLISVSEWNALQHPVAATFLATLYSDHMLTSRIATISCSGKSFKQSDLRKFAKSQVWLCSERRQTMLFSNTMTEKVEKLVELSLTKPMSLSVNSTQRPSTLTEEVVRI